MNITQRKSTSALNRDKLSFTSSERHVIEEYLKNPTAVGIYAMDLPHVVAEDFLSPMLDDGLDANDPRIKRLTNRINADKTFIYRVIDHLVSSDEPRIGDGIDKESIVSYLFDDMDITGLSARYSVALEFYKDKLYGKKKPVFSADTRYLKFKNGFVVIKETGYEAVTVISLDKSALEEMGEFFDLLDIAVKKSKIKSIFSPEEELLLPYLDIVRLYVGHLPTSASNKNNLRKAVSNYSDEDYIGAISSAGLVAEDYLSQVYETLTRTPVPRSTTLGELRNKVGIFCLEIKNGGKPTKKLTKTSVVNDIKGMNYRDNTAFISSVGAKIIDYINYRIEESIELRHIDATEKQYDYRIFPKLVKSNIDDLISYRNSVSHKSLEIVDSLKAQKSVAACLSVIMWWSEASAEIDGAKSRQDNYARLVSHALEYAPQDL